MSETKKNKFNLSLFLLVNSFVAIEIGQAERHVMKVTAAAELIVYINVDVIKRVGTVQPINFQNFKLNSFER